LPTNCSLERKTRIILFTTHPRSLPADGWLDGYVVTIGELFIIEASRSCSFLITKRKYQTLNNVDFITISWERMHQKKIKGSEPLVEMTLYIYTRKKVARILYPRYAANEGRRVSTALPMPLLIVNAGDADQADGFDRGTPVVTITVRPNCCPGAGGCDGIC